MRLLFSKRQTSSLDEDIVYSPNKYRETEGIKVNHANAILTVGVKDGEFFICNEIYVHELPTDQIIEIADRQGLSKYLAMYCDSAEPDRIQMWQNAGYAATAVVKELGSVQAQIDYLKQRRIHIHPDCVNTIKEIQQWSWKKDKKTGLYLDEPVAFMDDAMAALRYAAEPLRRPEMVYSNQRPSGW